MFGSPGRGFLSMICHAAVALIARASFGPVSVSHACCSMASKVHAHCWQQLLSKHSSFFHLTQHSTLELFMALIRPDLAQPNTENEPVPATHHLCYSTINAGASHHNKATGVAAGGAQAVVTQHLQRTDALSCRATRWPNE